MKEPLRVLLVEDSETDAALVIHELTRAGFDIVYERVDTADGLEAALERDWDVVLSDFNMPGFDASLALDLLKARGLDIPFIVVSGSVGEETAAGVVRSGAADYLLKDRLARLGQAVQRAIGDRRLHREKREAEHALGAMEERMRFALEASRVGIWEADFTTGVARWSETLETLHGIATGTFGGTFAAFLDRIHPEDRADVEAAIERSTREHTDANILYRTQWPDGTVHWISGIGRTFYDETGRPLRSAGIGFDVTERRALEDQYRHAQRMDAIGQLAGSVAHDFNNILMAIYGYSDLLAMALGPESEHQGDVAEIRRAAERAASLTRQLLAFSRRQILEPRVLDLRESLRAIEPMLKRLIGEHIAFSVRATDTVGPVRADPGQIEQVILNLALNARDAMPEGGSLLMEVVDVFLDESYARHHVSVIPGWYVMLAVSDTGLGMDAATQARIFEPFFTTKEAGKGTGLGLSTVYGIVKQSGGNIWVYSEPGHGTTFKVYLPRVDEIIESAR